jgi:hypothetical protein
MRYPLRDVRYWIREALYLIRDAGFSIRGERSEKPFRERSRRDRPFNVALPFDEKRLVTFLNSSSVHVGSSQRRINSRRCCRTGNIEEVSALTLNPGDLTEALFVVLDTELTGTEATSDQDIGLKMLQIADRRLKIAAVSVSQVCFPGNEK